MMNLGRKRKLETLIYAGLWALVVTLYLLDIMRARSYTSLPLLDWLVVGHMLFALLPFLVLFVVNNSVLVPRLLLRNRYMHYLLATVVLSAIVWGCQYFQFCYWMSQHGAPAHPEGHFGPHPILPLPLFLDLMCDLLIIGVNLAIALIFRQFETQLEQERLMKANAESRLAYLKTQINPHFYMNMLNNIHGMIELNQNKAQEMLIDMSNLMRYMLYESSNPMIALPAEIRFLKNYLSLMRQRYPEDIVRISAEFPSEQANAGVMIPPLLFLGFIENSFKHGISYRAESFVSVKMEVADGNVEFQCINSIHPSAGPKSGNGIGLRNVSQRLKLIYGDNYTLDIRSTDSTYLVTLMIPANENPHADN